MISTHRIAALFALTTTVAFASGCSKSTPPSPVDDTRTTSANVDTRDTPQAHAGLTSGQKIVILAGAAAAYYLYKHHQSSTASGAEGQYYLSKNGRVYYRDAEHRAHWVTPPPEGLRVPENEANEYRQYQGYENRTTGRDLVGLGTDE